MTTATKTPPAGQAARPAGRIRAAWAAAHAPVAGVPRWARIAAYAVPFTVLPSSLWRIAACTFHAPIVRGDVVSGVGSSGIPGVPLWLYVILLSIASELLAFTAIGLVSAWGEVFPRWVPVLRGRRVPPLAAVVPAALGAAVLTLLWTTVAVTLRRRSTSRTARRCSTCSPRRPRQPCWPRPGPRWADEPSARRDHSSAAAQASLCASR